MTWVSMAHNATLRAQLPVSELVRKQLDFAQVVQLAIMEIIVSSNV